MAEVVVAGSKRGEGRDESEWLETADSLLGHFRNENGCRTPSSQFSLVF